MLAVIGWRERLSLPDIGIFNLKVKVDSGARTSALHATHIKYVRGDDGRTWVSFRVVSQTAPRKTVRVRAPLLERRLVRSSSGHSTKRPVITTHIGLGSGDASARWEIELTLVNRDPMGFRMLLGRQALRGRYMIHPAKSFLQSKDSAGEPSL